MQVWQIGLTQGGVNKYKWPQRATEKKNREPQRLHHVFLCGPQLALWLSVAFLCFVHKPSLDQLRYNKKLILKTSAISTDQVLIANTFNLYFFT